MNRLFSNTYRLYYSLLLTFAGLILFMGYLNVQDAESFMIIALTFVVLSTRYFIWYPTSINFHLAYFVLYRKRHVLYRAWS